MSSLRNRCVGILLVLLISAFSFAKVPIRASSENGFGDAEPQWKLMDRSRPNVLTSNGKKVTVTREVICGGQDVYAGSCSAFGTPGSIVFLFQLQSTATNVNVQIGKLPNVPSAVGVNACDDTLNTRELCTEDTNPPSLATLADSITAVSKNKTSVTFTIPSFPAFPAGVDSEEGQGLTIYVVVQQSAAVPLTYPNIGIF